MSAPSGDTPVAAWTKDLRSRLDELIDEYRTTLHDCLDGLTDAEARVRLVPSKTTLLGLVKHVTYVEGVWFDQAVSGRSHAEIGIPSTPDRSFTLRKFDTIESVQAAYKQRCEESRRTIDALKMNALVEGRGERPVWALQLQVLRELAQHAGMSTSCVSRFSHDGRADRERPDREASSRSRPCSLRAVRLDLAELPSRVRTMVRWSTDREQAWPQARRVYHRVGSS